MSLINAVTRRRLDLAQHRNLYLDRLPHLPWSGRYLSDKALRIDKSKLDDPEVHSSQSLDPYFNLSYEDWLFRKTPNARPILFFYRNRPSVIIGKNQNPWKETTPDLLSSDNVPLVRRRSGGGTVYHDEGNINFSLLIPRNLFTRTLGSGMIESALRERLGIDRAGVNERGDLILWDQAEQRGSAGNWKKMSFLGKLSSAYKIVSQRAYHHGTMLISSDLSSLGRYLRSRSPNLVTKSVDSVRSPVTTLQTAQPSTTHVDFIRAVSSEFMAIFNKSSMSAASKEANIWAVDETVLEGQDERATYIRKGMEELKSWEWTYGSTPEFSNNFTINLPDGPVMIRITSKHAVITDVSIETTGPPSILDVSSHSAALQDELVGQIYSDVKLSLSGARNRFVTAVVEKMGRLV